MKSSPLDRETYETYKRLADWLNANAKMTRAKQAAALGISPATLYREIETLRELGMELVFKRVPKWFIPPETDRDEMFIHDEPPIRRLSDMPAQPARPAPKPSQPQLLPPVPGVTPPRR